MPNSPPTPAERFAALTAQLVQAVITRSHWGLPQPLIVLILDRLRFIRQRFALLAARIAEGRYKWRSVAAPQRRAATPRKPDKLPKNFGWLVGLVPDAIANRGQLETLFHDPAMAELMAAAAASLARPLRSLCRMLGVTPPKILALPAKPRPRPKPPAPAPKTPPPPGPQPPEWLRGLRRSLPQFARARARRPPKPA